MSDKTPAHAGPRRRCPEAPAVTTVTGLAEAIARTVAALEKFGLVLGDDPIPDADTLAKRVKFSAMSYAAGRRRGQREERQRSAQREPAVLSQIQAILEGKWAPGETKKHDGNAPWVPVIPDWIYSHFRAKQQQLLKSLWLNRCQKATELCRQLGYTGRTAQDSLRRRATETSRGLAEEAMWLSDP
jgi:hypothetical protein